jgi:hypothetical protein
VGIYNFNERREKMANRILFLGWNRAVAGREQQALDLFNKGMEAYTKWQSEGKIESFEPVFLSTHGGDLNGFIMLKGEANKLNELREDEEFIDMVIQAEYCLEGFGVVPGYIGEDLMDMFARWSKLIS